MVSVGPSCPSITMAAAGERGGGGASGSIPDTVDAWSGLVLEVVAPVED